MSRLAVDGVMTRYRPLKLEPFCVVLLMLVTVSVPEDYKVRAYGTASILPAAVISAAKFLSRLFVLSVLGFQLLGVLRTNRFRQILSRMSPLLAFAALAVASVAWSARRSVSASQSASLVVLLILAMTIAFNAQDMQAVRRVLGQASVCLAGIAAGLLILYCLAPQYGALTKNASGLFHSTSAGASSSLGLILLIACRLLWGWQWTRWLLFPGALAHMSVLIIAGNRLSLVLACALALVVCATLLPPKLAVSIAALGSLIGTTLILIDPNHSIMRGLLDEALDFGRQGQSTASLVSLSGRVEMWTTIWSSFGEAIWFGHGYFVTSAAGELYVWYEYGNWTAHNFLLQLLATSGIVGAALMLGGFLGLAIGLFRPACDCRIRKLILILGIWYAIWGVLNASFLGPLQTESVVFAIASGLACAASLGTAGEGVPS